MVPIETKFRNRAIHITNTGFEDRTDVHSDMWNVYDNKSGLMIARLRRPKGVQYIVVESIRGEYIGICFEDIAETPCAIDDYLSVHSLGNTAPELDRDVMYSIA